MQRPAASRTRRSSRPAASLKPERFSTSAASLAAAARSQNRNTLTMGKEEASLRPLIQERRPAMSEASVVQLELLIALQIILLLVSQSGERR